MKEDFRIPEGLANDIISRYYYDIVMPNDNEEFGEDEYISTLSNFAVHIVNEFAEYKMKRCFNQVFTDPEACYQWLYEHLPEMREIIINEFNL